MQICHPKYLVVRKQTRDGPYLPFAPDVYDAAAPVSPTRVTENKLRHGWYQLEPNHDHSDQCGR
jgi:hypothetical protein